MRFLPLFSVALLLAGCGAAPSPEQAVSDTGKKTAKADSARIVVSHDREERISGAFHFADGTGVIDPSETTPRTIINPDFVYEQITDEFLIASSRGPKWLQWERAMGPVLVEPFANSPADLFAFVAAAKAPAEIGEGEERGEPVMRYAATVDIEEFLATVPAEERADERELLLEYWPESETEGIAVQLALDSEGRLRRVDLVTYDGEEMVVEIFDYGIEVDATAPPKADVITWAKYEKLLQKECESLKKKGLEKTRPHCFSCHAGEGEA